MPPVSTLCRGAGTTTIRGECHTEICCTTEMIEGQKHGCLTSAEPSATKFVSIGCALRSGAKSAFINLRSNSQPGWPHYLLTRPSRERRARVASSHGLRTGRWQLTARRKKTAAALVEKREPLESACAHNVPAGARTFHTAANFFSPPQNMETMNSIAENRVKKGTRRRSLVKTWLERNVPLDHGAIRKR